MSLLPFVTSRRSGGLPDTASSQPGDPSGPEQRPMPGRVEFVAMMALLMGIMAFGIDLMLPALPGIASDLGLASSADAAPTVTTYFLGLALGQLAWGPLADSRGRKFSLNAGLGVMVAGAIASAVAPSLVVLLVTRFVWGLGGSAARSTTMTVIRDRYRGDRMASVTSLVFSVFILVPVVAPSLGAVGLRFTDWRGLFAINAACALLLMVWLRRLPETLDPDNVRPARLARVLASARVVFSNRVTVGYLGMLTSLSVAFTAWLALSEPIIAGVYGLEDLFPLVFGGLAAGMAVASLLNSRIVQRFGARRVVRVGLATCAAATGLWTIATLASGGVPALPITLAAAAIILMTQAFMQSNAQSIAMDPMGRVAGLASAIIGAASIGTGTVLGALVQVLYDDTLVAVTVAWFVATLVAGLAVWWADAGPDPEHAASAA